MPAIGQSNIDVSNLSDAELSQMLKDYGVDVGPINPATRRTYERKLIKLKTGTAPPTNHHYQPVDDDGDDEEVQVMYSEVKRTPPVLSEPARLYASPVYASSVRETYLSSDLRSRPPLLSDRKTTFSTSTPVSRSIPRKTTEENRNSIPLWLKLVAVGIALTLIYLIYVNMEPQAVSNIPEIQNKVEV